MQLTRCWKQHAGCPNKTINYYLHQGLEIPLILCTAHFLLNVQSFEQNVKSEAENINPEIQFEESDVY